MALIRKPQCELDYFQIKIQKSTALTLHLYNLMVTFNFLVRPVAPPSFEQKAQSLDEHFNILRSSGYTNEYPNEWIPLLEDLKANALSDADINWIEKLSVSELFVIWFFCRMALPITAEQNNASVLFEYYEMPVQLVSKIAETQEVFHSRYSQIGLELVPRDQNDMKSSVLDFVSCCSNLRSKKELLSHLKRVTDIVRKDKFYKFISNLSCYEQEILWEYLRTRKDMIGKDCESMGSFGAARIIGVFHNWPAPAEHKKRVENEARKYLSNTISAQRALKVRKNITLSQDACARLITLAGGERSISSYIEELIMSQEIQK